jgi:hypothetical protein
LAIAERIQYGLVSKAEGEAQIARLYAEIHSEISRRNTNEALATAARIQAMRAASSPPPQRVEIEQSPTHCYSWSDGIGIARQVYTDCN